jgi:hypothetical protein
VNRRLPTLLSKALELPNDYLWNNVQFARLPSRRRLLPTLAILPTVGKGQRAAQGSADVRTHGLRHNNAALQPDT